MSMMLFVRRKLKTAGNRKNIHRILTMNVWQLWRRPRVELERIALQNNYFVSRKL
jgi:hypothetical protein